MFKKILVFIGAMYVAMSFAAVDVNKATAADLDGIKGIGPSISGKIVDERKKGEFKDWTDFMARVKGVGDKNAAKFSAEGLTVGSASYKGAAPMAKKDAKPVPATADAMKPKADEAKAKIDPKKAAAPEKTEAAKPAASMPKK